MSDEENNQPITDAPPKQPAKPQEKTGRTLEIWYRFSYALILVCPFLAVFLPAFLLPEAGIFVSSVIVGLLAFLSLAAVFLLAVFRKNQIQKQGGSIFSSEFILPGLTTPALIILTALTAWGGSFYYASFFQSGEISMMPLIGSVVLDYPERNNGQIPDADKWCDQIKASVSEKSYLDNVKGFGKGDKESCPFALNEKALALGEDAPDDMVLVFPVKEGWNSSGGLELFHAEGGSYFVKVFLAGGKTETFRPKYAENLRWSVDDKMDIPEPPAYASSIIGGLICLSAAGAFIRKHSIFLRWRAGFAIFITVLSGGAGAGFAALAEGIFYSQYYRNYNIGWLAGAAAGIAAGVIFTGLLCKWKQQSPEGFKLMGWATAAGALTGLLASSAAHLILIAAYDFYLPYPIMIASTFGAYAGLVLGGISIAILQKLPIKNAQSSGQQ
ncbi:hypothetical protein L21SP3_00059 [Sedimentisphaera cyanobacteriorum]|uniref:Uncharacterized protein n=1 Tax=Sedimentisphaera cyanobacteriorum TaxID=1940790 RepID=A0A1Q2HM31_9BACT|nr:hypothetical protein [Sedimentisphaera cyanobacteriorum]AQQ08283.1 hypothetical protein L21SP3_00059 [Sedimentisphaera cyanobacteriorum]